MKTNLDRKIESLENAHDFLAELLKNGEMWHPEDDIETVQFMDFTPTMPEIMKLGRLMESVYEFDNDPCAFIMDWIEAERKKTSIAEIRDQLNSISGERKIEIIINCGEISDESKNDIQLPFESLEFWDNRDGTATFFIHVKDNIFDENFRKNNLVIN